MITIYDRNGYALADFDFAANISWVLNDIGYLDFDVPVSHPKCKEAFLQYGNLVYVRNENGLPDWVGVINTPRDWGRGTVSVHADSAEILLDWRYTQIETIYGSASEMFREIIRRANNVDALAIGIGDVSEDDSDRQETLGDSALAHIQRIAERTGNEWNVTPKIIGSKLVLLANWYQRIGEDTEIELIDGYNIADSRSVLAEDGDIYNYIEARADASTDDSRITTTAKDDESIAKYGTRSIGEVFSGNAREATLQENADEFIAQHKKPARTVDTDAINVDGLFSKLRIGNKYRYTSHLVGFTGDGIGTNAKGKLVGIEYREERESARILLELE